MELVYGDQQVDPDVLENEYVERVLLLRKVRVVSEHCATILGAEVLRRFLDEDSAEPWAVIGALPWHSLHTAVTSSFGGCVPASCQNPLIQAAELWEWAW